MALMFLLQLCPLGLFQMTDVLHVPLKNAARQFRTEGTIQWMVFRGETSCESPHEVEHIQPLSGRPWPKPIENWAHSGVHKIIDTFFLFVVRLSPTALIWQKTSTQITGDTPLSLQQSLST